MKILKGDAGYIRKRKKQTIIKTLFEFGVVVALLVLGIMQTGNRMNLLTIVAILGCLPASKSLVEVIMILPHQSVQADMVKQISEKTEHLSVVYDLVFTSEKKIMPIDCIVISGQTLCGYTSSQKTDISFAEKHIKQYLSANQFGKATVKIFSDQDPFLRRCQEMNQLASEKEVESKEEIIRQIILNISL